MLVGEWNLVSWVGSQKPLGMHLEGPGGGSTTNLAISCPFRVAPSSRHHVTCVGVAVVIIGGVCDIVSHMSPLLAKAKAVRTRVGHGSGICWTQRHHTWTRPHCTHMGMGAHCSIDTAVSPRNRTGCLDPRVSVHWRIRSVAKTGQYVNDRFLSFNNYYIVWYSISFSAHTISVHTYTQNNNYAANCSLRVFTWVWNTPNEHLLAPLRPQLLSGYEPWSAHLKPNHLLPLNSHPLPTSCLPPPPRLETIS